MMTYSRAGGTGVTRVTFATPIFDKHINPIPIKGEGGQKFSLSYAFCSPNNIDLPPAPKKLSHLSALKIGVNRNYHHYSFLGGNARMYIPSNLL